MGVLLDLETYARLSHTSELDAECLTELTASELETLADSMLAPTAQSRLDELLARNAAYQLNGDEQTELERLLEQVDQLNILKTRASYTRQSLASRSDR